MTDEQLRELAEDAKRVHEECAPEWQLGDGVLTLLDRLRTAERERDEAVSAMRVLQEECVNAGMPSGFEANPDAASSRA